MYTCACDQAARRGAAQIDVLEVDGKYYGFSGCHRFEAHQKLGYETIKCRVIKSNAESLRMHMV